MPHPASGGAKIVADALKRIRFVRMGCTNRPFFHIVVMEAKAEQKDHCIEQLGAFDPLPNQKNEKLVSLNYERIRYWIGEGAEVSRPVQELLGLAGFLPIHPRLYMTAWRARRKALESEKLNLWQENQKKLLAEAEESLKKQEKKVASASA